MKKELLFIIGTMHRGGAERVTSILTRELISRGWKIHLLMWGLNAEVDYPVSPKTDIINISDIKAPFFLPNRVRYRFPRLVSRIRKVIRQIEPDAVISIMLDSCYIAHSAMTRDIFRKTKHITSERNDPKILNRIQLFQAKKAYGASSACVFQTERAMRFFSSDIQAHSVVIPNPVTVKVPATDTQTHRIVSVGRLAPQKNQRLLIDAFSDVHRLHPEYRLDIYGRGPLQSTLQEQINSLGLQDSVTLCGEVPDIHEKISDAEIFVMSSDYEGMSNALIEAMIMGLACISTDTAGSDEIISDGKNGLIVPVGDRKALTEAMLKLIENKELADRFGLEAKKCADKFSVKKIIDQWEELLLQVITERGIDRNE